MKLAITNQNTQGDNNTPLAVQNQHLRWHSLPVVLLYPICSQTFIIIYNIRRVELLY